MNRNKIEEKAVRVVADYIDDHCPKLKSFCQANDKTPIWDGEIHIYRSKDHKVANFMARVPLQIKGTTNTNDDFYRIEREYLEAYHGDGGCVFFMIQEDKGSYKPQRILYAMLSMEDVNAKLQRNTQTIKIGLKEVPADPLDFQEELVKFANQRRGGPIENPAPKEIAALVKRFRDIEQHLDEVSDRGVKIELRSFLDTIKSLKNDGTVGWRDTFVYLSRKVLELTLQHINGYDALDLELELANYLYKQRLYHLTEDYYLHALAVCRERAESSIVYKQHVAGILSNLAGLHMNNNQFEEAESELYDALATYNKLTEDNPGAYLISIAMTQNNLAIIHKRINKYEDAETEYKVALVTFMEQVKANPEIYLPYVAGTLNNLAVLHRSLNQFDAAEDEHKKALGTYLNLAKENPNAYLPYVITTLNNLAVLHNNLNNHKTAENEYKTALIIQRILAKGNPDAYLPDVAMTLNNLGNLHSSINQYSTAEDEYKEALDIYRKLANANPDAYLRDVAVTLNHLGLVHWNSNQFRNADDEYKEALTIIRKLAEENYEAHMADLAEILNNCGILHKHSNQPSTAEVEYKEALDIRRKLAKVNPDVYLEAVADTLYNLALLIMKDKQRIGEAKKACQEALNIFNAMAKNVPQRFNRKVDKARRLLDELDLNELLDIIGKL
ncbi:MAG: tetratricopeptide repeat protein [Muribaculaceae bacterium]|nr:tetratricopeptide repeat protein [Muribaculaceae bacterium]